MGARIPVDFRVHDDPVAARDRSRDHRRYQLRSIALRLLGFVPDIPLQPLRKLFPWMYLGFTINLFSGSSLLAANLSNDLGNWLFIAKLVFIAVRDDQPRADQDAGVRQAGHRWRADGLPKNSRGVCDRGAGSLGLGDGRGAVYRLPELRRSVAWLLSGDEQWKRYSDFLDHAYPSATSSRRTIGFGRSARRCTSSACASLLGTVGVVDLRILGVAKGIPIKSAREVHSARRHRVLRER